ncbi:MAG: hypothetical protein ABSF71_33435 [Terriglobia bacterium]
MRAVSLLGKTCLLAFILLAPDGAGQMPKAPPVIQPPDRPQAPPLPVAVTGEIHAPLNAAKLKVEADQLAKLAQSIPADVDKAAKGQLAQDLGARLKQIEKLSKQLRREISP